jgi:unsaturated rhamnogalacturonyl hydrolase
MATFFPWRGSRRLPLNQVAGQFDTPREHRPAAQVIEQEREGFRPHLTHRNVHRRQRRCAEGRLRQIVHANDRDLAGHRNALRRQSPDDAERKAVACSKYGCEIQAASIDALLDSSGGKIWQPVADLNDQIVNVANAGIEQRVTPAFKATLDRAAALAKQEQYAPVAKADQMRCRKLRGGAVAWCDARMTHEWVVAVDQHNRLGKPFCQRQHVVLKCQEQATGNCIIGFGLSQQRRLVGAARDRPRHQLDTQNAGAFVQPVKHVESELRARVVDHRRAARRDNYLTANHRRWNCIIQLPRGLNDGRAHRLAHACCAGQRSRRGADRDAAALSDLFQPDPPVWLAAFAIHLSAHPQSTLQKICRLRNLENDVTLKNRWLGGAAGGSMTIDARQVETALAGLVRGMTGLRADGRFVEPNLDGTPGDYVSFDSWEWPQGVGLYGLVKLWTQTGDPTLLNTVEDWYDRRIAAGLPQMNVNTTAPMLALSEVWRRERQPRFEAVLADWADRVVETMPRTPEGGFQHNVSDKINDDELWDDTLFMVALFLASYGQATGQRRYIDEAEKQFLVHARYLADTRTGLWYHGWTFAGRHNFARALWARGNSWITVGILDLVDLAELSPAVRDYLLGVLGAQVDTLLDLQAASGAWHTLLDDPSSYEEISATAGFGYGLMKAARIGLADGRRRQAGLRALEAVVRNINADGVVDNVSYGTRMGHDLQFYRDIPIQPTGYGQALSILCLAEGLATLKSQRVAG